MIKKFFLNSIILFFIVVVASYSQVMTINGNSTLFLNRGSVVSINGGVKINSSAAIEHSNVSRSTLNISGNFAKYGTYTQNGFGVLNFFGSLQDTISGNSFSIERLWINKTGNAMLSLAWGVNLTVQDNLRLISNNLFNIDKSTVTFEEKAMIYEDEFVNYKEEPLTDPFSATKHITSRGDSASTGAIVRKIAAQAYLVEDVSIRFPIGTPADTTNPINRLYSPVRYMFNAGQATFDSGAYLSVKCIAAEHYATEVKEVALRKYWKTAFDSINAEPGGYNIRFDYNAAEVQGTEELYLLCLFFRPFDGLNGTYYINAGEGYGIEPINHRFYVDEVNRKDTLSHTKVLLDGEWTAGQEEAISTFYYSRKDGDWNDPTTWSKQGYNGVPSTTYPSTVNDKAFIGNGRTVTIAETTPDIDRTIVENGGRLKIPNSNHQLLGDSLFLKAGGILAISSPDGIVETGATGQIQTSKIRSYSSDAIYEFIGANNQVTGPGIPDIVRALVINKNAITDTVSLTKSILIKDSISINEGCLHLFKSGHFTADGETGDVTNRRIIMHGGEFVMQDYPQKYQDGNFSAGTITFDGTGSFRVPSSLSPTFGEPAVLQYHNLSLKGNRVANTFVTFDPSGEIRISGLLDISKLALDATPSAERFLITGSKVVFNGAGDQNIQTGYASPKGINYRLKFHDLVIAGSGVKNVMPPNDADPNDNYLLVRSLVDIKSGTLKSNNHWIKVLGSWLCEPGATYDAGSGLVTFEAEGKVTSITSNGSSFNNLRIQGTLANGYVNYLDSLNIAGNLEINPNSLRSMNSASLAIQGNWLNKGQLVDTVGRVYFNGTGNQTLTHSGLGTFNKLTVNKPSGMVNLTGDSLIVVKKNLTLTKGNIGGRASANKPLVVDGTITRTGATPGHVDGRLRLPSKEGNDSLYFAVGLGNDFAPMNMIIIGSGGAGGYLDGYVILDTDAPNMTRAVIRTQVANGPELDTTKNVRKVWVLQADDSKPINSRFKLANSRTYSVGFSFPASDVRNGAVPEVFEIGQRDTTTNNGRWSKPLLSERNPTSTKFELNANLNNTAPNYFILGTPQTFTYYSIADGDFEDETTWSTASYMSNETALRAPIANDNIKIGNGRVVTINNNFTVNSGRTLRVETGAPGYENGHLIFGNNDVVISGSGTFLLDSGAAITIRHAAGIVNQGSNTGCVRTSTRNYNYNNNDRVNFIYAGTGNSAQTTGNGLPTWPRMMQTLQIDRPVGQNLNITGTSPVILQTLDSLYIKQGNLNLSNTIMKLEGNFVIDDGGTFTPGTQAISNGNSYGENNKRDSSTWKEVVFFNGGKDQYIRGTYNSSDTNKRLIFNRFTISKRSGNLISRFNISTTTTFLTYINRGNVDMATYNKYLEINPSGTYAFGRVDYYANNDNMFTNTVPDPLYGWVEGRLIRQVNSSEPNRIFPIGTKTKYAPILLNRDANQGGNGNGQVAGLLEIQAVDGNHPLFSGTYINENTNIQRYYEFSIPVGSDYVQGVRGLRAQIFFTTDEPRGGINPTNYRAFRLLANNTWSSTDKISNTVPHNATDMLPIVNNPSPVGSNQIFTAATVANGRPSITLMIGETPANVQRVFYVKQSGLWNDKNTWANESANILYENTEQGYAISGNAANDYPRFNTGTTKDIAVIGNGDSVYFNIGSANLNYLLLEKSANGKGILVMPGENYIKTDQYVQKNGGKLYIGSSFGIETNQNSQGNIRRNTNNSIINYDWNNKGLNEFAYIGTSTNVVQNTGNGLPATVASLTIDYNKTANNRYVDITNDANLTINDSLVFLNGRLRNNNGNRTITVRGDIINYSDDVGFDGSSNRAVIFDSTKNQRIRGTSDLTAFPSTMQINKPSGTVTANRDFAINSVFDVLSNTYLNVDDNRTLTFGNNATINNIDSFRVNRMIKVSGGPNTAKLKKTFANGTGVSRNFTFPMGEDSLGLRLPRYGEAKFDLNSMNFSAGNDLTVSLISKYPHPNAPSATPNMLSKYWSVTTSNIALSNGNLNTRFRYNDAELKGNVLAYLPAIYRRTDVSAEDPGWSSVIFGATNLEIDTTNKYIITTAAKTLPYYDWTAGEPNAFAKGRVYWSKATGDWDNPNSWTNVSSSGLHNSGNISALNYPGFYPGDTVFIGSNHTITYKSSTNNPIDSLGIGITAPSSSPTLTFATATNSNKSLDIRGSLMLGATGLFQKQNSNNNSIDTLRIRRDLSNLGTNANRGISFRPRSNANIKLELNSNDSSRIMGEGIYSTLGSVRIIKSDSVWNMVNKSGTFSSRFSTSVTSYSDVNFDLDAGMFVQDVNSNITLSTNGDGDVFLGDLVGLVSRQGKIIFSDGLICGQNASVWLVGGDMDIGNQKDENFLYESVTIIDVGGTSKLSVAGSFRRRFSTSNVDFRIRENALIEVMTVGAVTNSLERRAAFDFGEANSNFSMSDNSKVIIYRPMEKKSMTNEKDPDYLVSAMNYSITGGTIQFGDPALSLSVEPFSMIASVPIWNLDLANTYGKDLFQGSAITTVRNDFTIRNTSIFNQNGNNLNIGGDLIVDGQYKTGTVGTRRVAFIGDASTSPATKSNQTIKISSGSNDGFYDFAVTKADSGTVILSNDGAYSNSNLIVRNTLEFSVLNKALINTGDNRYVQVGTNSTDLASIQRFGNGHVKGYLRRWINNGIQNKLFTVGTDVFTPADLSITSGVGTEGLLSVRAYGIEHSDAPNSTLIQPNTDIDRYWQIKPISATPFGLGAGRSFSLTTQFIKGIKPIGDIKSGSTFGIFEHFRYSPELPNVGSWYTTVPFMRTDSSTTSHMNEAFGDFVIGEISGERFFSAQNGTWNELSTWKVNSYTGPNAARLPNQETDRVFIGNGKTVTIQKSNPKVRSVTIESYNGLPGRLRVLDERYLRSLSFVINDSCFLATDDAFGFTSVSGATPNIGAIRSTNTRSYGKSIYEYVGTTGQAVGDGPFNPKTIVINNTGLISNEVAFSGIDYTIEDTILVNKGGLRIGSGLVNLKGQFVIENNTYITPNNGTLKLIGSKEQAFVLNNETGISVYNLKLSKSLGNLTLKGTADSSALLVLNNLSFDSSNVAYITGRANNKKVILNSTATTITRSGAGHIDGWLLRYFPASGVSNFVYEVGYGATYMPATLDVTAGSGVEGFVAGRVNSPPSISLSRINPDKKVNYYWILSPWTDFSLGNRTANTILKFPSSELSNLSGGVPNDAMLFRRSIPEESPAWTDLKYNKLTYNLGVASVEITNPANYWVGLGEFYISEKNFPTFYSRQTGVWNDNNTWTLSPTHIGPACEPGDYPDSGDPEYGDKAYIGLDHIVNLNINEPQLDTVVVRQGGKLDVGILSINCPTCVAPRGLFELRDSATVAFGGLNYPTTSTSLKNFSSYLMSANSTIEYYGTQSVINNPFAPYYTSYPGNLKVSGIDTVTVDVPIIVNKNLIVDPNATLQINAISLHIYGSVYNSGNIFNTKMLEIGN